MEHDGQVLFDFLYAAAGHDGDHWLRWLFLKESPLLTILCNGIYAWITYVMDRVVVLLLKEIHLKGENAEQFIHIAADTLDAVFFPGPDFRRDIVVHRNLAVLFHVFGNLQVETWVVHQYHHVGLPLQDILLACAHIAQNRAGMGQYGDKTHIRHFTVVLHQRAAHSRHLIPSIEAEVGV